jgi:bifunctional DNA-binding transcriptional regulator/antitoxin component of YhaV-PrlF toxin-antitoxin module
MSKHLNSLTVKQLYCEQMREVADELVKMSPKGQLVVPYKIRRKEKLKPSDRFLVFEINGGIVFKKVYMPNPKEEFESLSKELRAHVKKHGITHKDVDDAVARARANK